MNQRGVISVVLLYVLGGLALTQAVPDWGVTHWFAKGPPTIELSKAETALATAKSDAAKAQADLLAAQAKERAATVDQVRYSQQMVAGIPVALKRLPASPEVQLAAQLAERAQKGLSAAIGDLPADRQAEIMAIVDGALSAKQAEVDAAKAALAAKDAQLVKVTAAKVEVEAQIPVLTSKATVAAAKADAAQTLVTAKTAEVVAFADKAAAELQENGSLRATIEKYLFRAGIAVLLYLLIHGCLPALAQEFPQSNFISKLYRWTTSLTSAHKVTTT